MAESRVHKAGFKALDRAEALRSFEQTGILAGRWTKKGELTHVKTASLGWLDVKTYDMLKNLKDWQPTIAATIRAGYELKAWLWSSELDLEVLATGESVPLAVFFVTAATALAAYDVSVNNQPLAYLDMAALALPFGEVYLLLRGFSLLIGMITNDLSQAVSPHGAPVTVTWADVIASPPIAETVLAGDWIYQGLQAIGKHL